MQDQRKTPALLRFLLPNPTEDICPDCNSKSVVDFRAPVRRIGFFVFLAFFSIGGIVMAFIVFRDQTLIHPTFIFLFFAIGGSLMSVVFFGIVAPLFVPHWGCRHCRKQWR